MTIVVKNKKLIIGIIALLAIIVLTVFLGSKLMQKDIISYSNDYYNLSYHNSWRMSSKDDNSYKLVDSDNSTLSFSVTILENEYKYYTVTDLLDKILYETKLQNENYEILAEEAVTVTKSNYDGYKVLYENDNKQVLLVIAKSGDKLLTFIYEAESVYFDLSLDSVNTIIYNTTLKGEKFEFDYEVDIEQTGVEFEEDDNIKVKENNTHKVASSNYEVEYSLPSNFEIVMLDSNFNSFDYGDLEEGSIGLSVSISQSSIYSYFEEDRFGGLYNEKEFIEELDATSNVEATLDKIDSEYDNFIYKITYDYYDEFSEQTTSRETIFILFAIDNLRTVIFEFESKKVNVTKELIDSITIDKVTNYSSYVTSELVDDKLVFELKRFTDFNKDKITIVDVVLPSSYNEIDVEDNIYEVREFGFNYNEKKELYQYEVRYNLASHYSSLDTLINSINNSFIDSYGISNDLVYNGDVRLNDKIFKKYTGGYTLLGGYFLSDIGRFYYYVNKTVLFHELDDGGYLVIEISGNDVEVGEQQLIDATDFDINIKEEGKEENEM